MTRVIRIATLFGVLLCFTPGVPAQDISIEFMARPTAPISAGTPGHVFFCIGVPVGGGVKEECFGFYPQSPLKAFDGPGTVSNEFSRPAIGAVSTSLKHRIDEGVRSAVYTELKKWSGVDYKLVVNNCIDLVFGIAKATGLVTPNRQTVLLPTDFVGGIKSLYWTGNWNSTDIDTRFRLQISGNNAVTWTERNSASGQQLSKTSSLSLKSDGEAVVERPNSSDVLQLLGFQQNIIPSILAAGPKPSFLKLTRKGHRVLGEWNGIVVIKDAKGHFSQLKQPGASPAKNFDFDRIP
jgi:hypothetical protein